MHRSCPVITANACCLLCHVVLRVSALDLQASTACRVQCWNLHHAPGRMAPASSSQLGARHAAGRSQSSRIAFSMLLPAGVSHPSNPSLKPPSTIQFSFKARQKTASASCFLPATRPGPHSAAVPAATKREPPVPVSRGFSAWPSFAAPIDRDRPWTLQLLPRPRHRHRNHHPHLPRPSKPSSSPRPPSAPLSLIHI